MEICIDGTDGAGKTPLVEALVAAVRARGRDVATCAPYRVVEVLHPSSKGKRVRFSSGKKTVVDGPFVETKELVAGYWIWQVRSIEEAVEWARRRPDPMPGEESELEIRPVFEAEDFGKEFTPELRAQEERLRAEVERQRQS
jgi:hypothetical protein